MSAFAMSKMVGPYSTAILASKAPESDNLFFLARDSTLARMSSLATLDNLATTSGTLS